MSSVIGAIRDYIQSYQALEKDVPVWVDMLGADVTSYSVHTMPGKIVEEDIIGNKTVVYPFAFGSVESTAEQNETLETAEFYETFAEWLDEQTDAGIFPDLGASRTAESIEAADLASILSRAEDTGIYQIICRLTYREKGKKPWRQ